MRYIYTRIFRLSRGNEPRARCSIDSAITSLRLLSAAAFRAYNSSRRSTHRNGSQLYNLVSHARTKHKLQYAKQFLNQVQSEPTRPEQ